MYSQKFSVLICVDALTSVKTTDVIENTNDLYYDEELDTDILSMIYLVNDVIYQNKKSVETL